MLNREKFNKIIALLEAEQKSFPSFIALGAYYTEPLLRLWFERLNEHNCTDAEFESVYRRIIYHLNKCTCHLIPDEEQIFKSTIKMIDLVDEPDKLFLADSIIDDLNNDNYKWFREYGGTKSYASYSHFYHHLIAHRSGREISYCPFNKGL